MEAARVRASTKENLDPFFDTYEKLQNGKKYRMELKVYYYYFFINTIIMIN
jgi:hypothetical protein